ncbi:hypothetical protein NQ176_g6233 [Zarea fungicola]|uniref:Uncharacterized protein n=1 Tax=Zarea fungicola TaxID=93591 RepID=A0ACC1N4B9_9HYPO|nr:hypothetical protein NQ176_g6233 [Lecanicillium fungicola]
MAYLKRHVAGLQKVQWLGQEYLFSSGGNEELFAWRVRQLDSAYAGRIAVMCEGVFMDKSPVEDLRILDFDVSALSIDGEVTVAMLVTLAFSNSELKTYSYSAERGFELVCKGMYTGVCLTQVRHLAIEDGDLQVVTASTDGHIALWRGSSAAGYSNNNNRKIDSQKQKQHGTYELTQTLRVHQSSIKSLDMKRLAGGSGRRDYGVVTGGDDNALAITLLKQDAAAATEDSGLADESDTVMRLGFSVELGAVVRRAHAAAITGIAILGASKSAASGSDIICVSVSNDQWVKTWRIREEDGAGSGYDKKIELLGEGYSGVADPGDVVVLDEAEQESDLERRRRVGDSRFMIAGVGIEVWRMK